MRYMMLMIPSDYEKAEPSTMPDAEGITAMMKYSDALQEAGVLLALNGLHTLSMGARVSFAGGKPRVSDSPSVEVGQVVGGDWMIQVESRAEAIEWAMRCPASDWDVIELRQVQEMSDSPADVRQAISEFPEMKAQCGPQKRP